MSLHNYFLVTLNQYVLNGSAQFASNMSSFQKMYWNLNKESFIGNISIFGHTKGGFFSESEIRFLDLQISKKNYSKKKS